MSIEADAGSSSAPRPLATADAPQSRPYFWSVRRELWEHRSVWIAPFAAAAVVLFGFSISLVRTPHTMRAISKLSPDKLAGLRFAPFGIAVAAILLTTVVVGIFYCLGTLYNERRDRSILFWKSMPVSDLTTLLSKATVPLIMLPALALVIICVTQLLMLLIDLASLGAHGSDVARLWSTVSLPQLWEIVLYLLFTLTLWHAPVYAYLLALSAWVRKGAFLWAVLPPVALSIFEKLAFDTSYIGNLIHDRLFGIFDHAFVEAPKQKGHFHLPMPDAAGFFSSPGLWIGLAIAVALLALAVWLRRRREPM
jgi:ABC-2 type transport system permease protein